MACFCLYFLKRIASKDLDRYCLISISFQSFKVVGFDNSPKAKNLIPQLTSFNVDKVALGKKITNLLQDRVSNPSQENQVIYITSKVIVRASA